MKKRTTFCLRGALNTLKDVESFLLSRASQSFRTSVGGGDD